MNKIREIDLDGDGLHFVVKVENNMWAFVDSEDREVIIGDSPEDVIARFYSDGVKREDIKINILDSNKVEVCVKDECWECNAEFE
jgi:hypothetical protein